MLPHANMFFQGTDKYSSLKENCLKSLRNAALVHRMMRKEFEIMAFFMVGNADAKFAYH